MVGYQGTQSFTPDKIDGYAQETCDGNSAKCKLTLNAILCRIPENGCVPGVELSFSISEIDWVGENGLSGFPAGHHLVHFAREEFLAINPHGKSIEEYASPSDNHEK